MNISFFRWVLALSMVVAATGSQKGFAEDRSALFGDIFDRTQLTRAMKIARERMTDLEAGLLQLAPVGIVRDAGVSSYRFQHSVRGVEVLGGITVVQSGHDGEEGVVFESTRVSVNTNPSLSSVDAIRVASAETRLDLRGARSSLKILPEEDRSGARLIYWVDFPISLTSSGGELMVDAHSGRILARLSKFRTIAPVDVYSAKGQGKSVLVNMVKDPKGQNIPVSCEVGDLATGATKTVDVVACGKFINPRTAATYCQLVKTVDGSPMAVNPAKCELQVRDLNNSVNSSDSAVRAAQNSKKVLEYYLTIHGRDSFDGKGATAKSLVQVGVDYANAAWISDLGVMMYGEGDGKTLADFTTSVDVAGHEMTHGVISRTAKFINVGETGALDEAYADFFGLMIADSGSWVVGEGIFLDNPTQGIRDLENPASLNHSFLDSKGRRMSRKMPKHLKEKFPSYGRVCDDLNDRCYVHGNSTIFSHALYRIHESIGREKTEKVVYQGLTRYLSESSNFKDAVRATLKACSSLYDSDTCEKVKAGFMAVGL